MGNEVGNWTDMYQCRVQGRNVMTVVMYRTRYVGYFITRRDIVSVSCRNVLRGDSYKICGWLNKIWWRKITFYSINTSDLYDNKVVISEEAVKQKLYRTYFFMYVGLFCITFYFDGLKMLSFSVFGKLISSAKFKFGTMLYSRT